MSLGDFNKPSTPYFLSHSVGLLPATAEAGLTRDYFNPWAAGRSDLWPRWLETIAAWKRALAPVIGAGAMDICPQTNISSALTKILFALPERKGRTKIILTEDDFPTAGFVFEQGRRIGLDPVIIQGGAPLADPDAWSRACADDVRVVHVTHVFSNRGVRSPVAEIVRRAKAAGACVIVDVAQSAGALPVDAARWGADFVVGTSIKYLCGGPGAAWLWVNPDYAAEYAPADVGWFSHEDPFEFDIRNFRYAAGAARFWGGTPSVAPYAVARAGAEAIAAAGVTAVDTHAQGLLDRLLARLPSEAVLSHVKPSERGAALIVRPRMIDEARAALKEENIVHDERLGGFRFSVHLYTEETEIDRLAEVLKGFA
ncbi:MAG: aminotransferase class V-fold PLP-dependent enzyme [Parvularculaceae bacterium]|nr:aminotransferase class V-fold PLP-dependent enzyme [Parvularculaceae bacterium]